MILLVDTSVAVPLLLRSHVAHELVEEATGGRPVQLAGHAAIETYAVLTRLPGDARLAPVDALTLIVDRFAGVAPADGDAVNSVLPRLAHRGVGGGATYDGLVASAVLAVADGVLLSRDRRAAATYARLGVNVELVGG